MSILDRLRARKEGNVISLPDPQDNDGYLAPQADGHLVDYVVTVKASVSSVYPPHVVEQMASDILNDLAAQHGAMIDEISVREGDGL